MKKKTEFRKVIDSYNMTIKNFAELIEAPAKTVENWSSGRYNLPDYQLRWMKAFIHQKLNKNNSEKEIDSMDTINDIIDLKILLNKIKKMSFEEGKAYIKENYNNFEIFENIDKDYNILDIDFYFKTIENDDDFLSFTSKIKLDDENFDLTSGYWNIHGERE